MKNQNRNQNSESTVFALIMLFWFIAVFSALAIVIRNTESRNSKHLQIIQIKR